MLNRAVTRDWKQPNYVFWIDFRDIRPHRFFKQVQSDKFMVLSFQNKKRKQFIFKSIHIPIDKLHVNHGSKVGTPKKIDLGTHILGLSASGGSFPASKQRDRMRYTAKMLLECQEPLFPRFRESFLGYKNSLRNIIWVRVFGSYGCFFRWRLN